MSDQSIGKISIATDSAEAASKAWPNARNDNSDGDYSFFTLGIMYISGIVCKQV